jgi:hypothetical protein
MLERFGHTIITDPSAPDLVTIKAGRKFITACATPADLMPTATRDLARLHDAVIAANAARGYFITARSFTGAAEQYAESAPLDGSIRICGVRVPCRALAPMRIIHRNRAI